MKRNYDYDSFDKNEFWSEMSPERSPFETDEDYNDRMISLFGDDWNFW